LAGVWLRAKESETSASKMTCIVSSGALNSTHSLTPYDILALETVYLYMESNGDLHRVLYQPSLTI